MLNKIADEVIWSDAIKLVKKASFLCHITEKAKDLEKMSDQFKLNI